MQIAPVNLSEVREFYNFGVSLTYHNSTLKLEANFSSEIAAYIYHTVVTSHKALNFIDSAGRISNLRQPMQFLHHKARPAYFT